MKVTLTLAASTPALKYSVLKRSKHDLLLTLVRFPPKEASAKAVMGVPYIDLELQMLWNAGTESAQHLPTLSMLAVPKRLKGKGIGLELLSALLDFMKARKIPWLVFDNYNREFWSSVSKSMKDNVYFPKEFKKRIGFFRLSHAVELGNIL